jgi:hypothetical protein
MLAVLKRKDKNPKGEERHENLNEILCARPVRRKAQV